MPSSLPGSRINASTCHFGVMCQGEALTLSVRTISWSARRRRSWLNFVPEKLLIDLKNTLLAAWGSVFPVAREKGLASNNIGIPQADCVGMSVSCAGWISLPLLCRLIWEIRSYYSHNTHFLFSTWTKHLPLSVRKESVSQVVWHTKDRVACTLWTSRLAQNINISDMPIVKLWKWHSTRSWEEVKGDFLC